MNAAPIRVTTPKSPCSTWPGYSRNKRTRRGRTPSRLAPLPRRNPVVVDSSLAPPASLPMPTVAFSQQPFKAQGRVAACVSTWAPKQQHPPRPTPACPCRWLASPIGRKRLQPGRLLFLCLEICSPFSSTPQYPLLPRPLLQCGFLKERSRWAFPEKSPRAFSTSLLLSPWPREARHCGCHGNCAGATCCFLKATDVPFG